MMIIMRYPEGHKQAVRERIVGAATAALRRDGLGGVSIPVMMKSAGLTHGAFYAHFETRDELVTEAIAAAAAATAGGIFADGVPLEETLRAYLSLKHLAAPQTGCVVAALGTEGMRQSTPVRKAFARAARGLLALVDRKMRGSAHDRQTPGDAALRLTATMVGAVVLGRLVDDPILAERILQAARKQPVGR